MNRKILFSVLMIVVLAGATFLSAAADDNGPLVPLNPPPSAEDGVMTNETPTRWFVQLSGAPTADGGSRLTAQANKRTFRSNANRNGLRFTENYAYSTLFNGLSITIKPSDLSKLARIPGVKAIYPMGLEQLPAPTEGVDPDLLTSLSMIGADIAQSELGFTGAGVKVAVIDTGIDYNHPDLGGNGVTESDSHTFPTARVVKGYDFVGDAYNADPASADYNPVPTPDNYPDDCAGHGTHVSGIIGADGAVTGVAPGVTFGAYRIFGCAGSANDDVILAALERAFIDGMDVINMSLGDPYTWPQYPLATASDSLVKHGVVVVASIGNNGANGLYSAGAPGLGKDVIGVASFDNVTIVLPYFTISPDNAQIGFNAAAAAPTPPTSGTYPMARTGTPTSAADGCAALPAGSLTGQVVLIRRGTCAFYLKAFNAQTAGAAGVVLYNNTSGRVNPTVAGSPPITIPVVSITAADGATIDSRIAAGPEFMTWTDQVGNFANATGNLISSFSSYGLSPDLALKPDIGAPGGFIWSTYPLELGGHASLSGTSMSSPHVAGAAALYLQAHPRTKAKDLRDILQNSADPKPWWGNPGLGFLDNVHRQGAGMLDIDDAILATTLIKPGKIAAGESQAGPFAQTLTLKNSGTSAVTYDLGFVNALSTEGVLAVVDFWDSDASVTFSAPSVAVPAGGSASVVATIHPATYPDQGQYGGYIVFTPQGGGQVYSVPFAGFVGDYQSIQVLTPTVFGFPALGWTPDGVNFGFASPGDVFTLVGFDDPYVLVHFDHQSRRFRVDIYAQSGYYWGRAFDEEYLPRNSTGTGFFAFPFDGITVSGNKNNPQTVPDGTYYAVISVLKANGGDKNPAHWETWTSPTFVIDRP